MQARHSCQVSRSGEPMWVGRVIMLALLGAIAALTCAAGAAELAAERVYAESYANPAKAARQLWKEQARNLVACDEQVIGKDHMALLDALEITETFANPAFVRLMEWLFYQLHIAVGRTPPDLTYGPMQIRYSKFLTYRGSAADDVFDRCAARSVAWRLL